MKLPESPKMASNASRASIMRELPSSFVPTDADVLCAKGLKAKQHPGNQLLTTLIRSYMKEYSAASTKLDKSFVVSKIMKQIRSSGGAFVRRVDGVWMDIGCRNAREKIGQAFRDLLHEQYRSSTKAKASIRRSREGSSSELSTSSHNDRKSKSHAGRKPIPAKSKATRKKTVVQNGKQSIVNDNLQPTVVPDHHVSVNSCFTAAQQRLLRIQQQHFLQQLQKLQEHHDDDTDDHQPLALQQNPPQQEMLNNSSMVNIPSDGRLPPASRAIALAARPDLAQSTCTRHISQSTQQQRRYSQGRRLEADMEPLPVAESLVAEFDNSVNYSITENPFSSTLL